MAVLTSNSRRWRRLFAVSLAGLLGAGLCIGPTWVSPRVGAQAAPQNLALGRPYTMSPPPNYSLTADAGDSVQLTDGSYTTAIGTFWMHSNVVGWSHVAPVTIVIDLQSVQPISGVSFSTAARAAADVHWPRSIFVLTSDDGRQYFPATDLAQVPPGTAGPPSETAYATFRYAIGNLRTHGRYVAIIVDPIGPYVFCDEIEVLRGDPSFLSTPLAGEPATDLRQYFVNAHMNVSIGQRLSIDLQSARTALASAAALDADLRARLTSELDSIEYGIAGLPPAPAGFKAVLPLNDLHARIFAVQGAIAQAAGFPALSAWAVNPWDFARPLDKPTPASTQTASILAMNGETRSGAVNFSNSSGQPVTVTLRTRNLNLNIRHDLHLFEAEWTDTRELTPVADALVPLSDQTTVFVVPAGMTRQIWMSFAPQNRLSGTYRGTLQATTDAGTSLSVPIALTVLAGSFPARPTLHVGGWDYTDTTHGLGLTPTNVGPLIDQLHALKVDSPWATLGVMPSGTFDALGQLQTSPDTTAFDAWVANWPDASRYFVFVGGPDSIGGVQAADEPRFTTAVGQWIAFWASHAVGLGIQPSQLMLLLVDEPMSAAQDQRIVHWARAVKAGAPDVGIWENPNYRDPASAAAGLMDVSDVLAVKRSLIVSQGASYTDFFRQRGQQGQALDVYGASGPARLLDPYTYDRLQAWICADLGAGGSYLWSFADDAGGHSWNEYGSTDAPYSPFFLSSDQVTISKHSEAIREGMEDFEYLTMLRGKVANPRPRQRGTAALSDAQDLLTRATAAVLQSTGASDLTWTADKDRSVADGIRLQVAAALAKLR